MPATAANPRLQAERQRAVVVHAQVDAINANLEKIVQSWDGARVRLHEVDAALRANEIRLRVARANLAAAQHRIELRIAELYRAPTPTLVDVIAGATSVGDLVNRLEASHVLAAQDGDIARLARSYRTQVAQRERLLRRQRAVRAHTVAALGAKRRAIAGDLARERRLLASIHQSIESLVAEQAARERRLAALARAKVAREVAAAQARAAAAAVALPAAPALAPPDGGASDGSSAPAPPVVAPAAPPGAYATAASIALRYLGVPYVWGGASPGGFDCSGLVTYVYAQLGVSLPHYTVSQWNATIPIAVGDLQPGDLVFFDGLGHVGIYIGGGQFVHAPHTGTVVQIGSLDGYWSAHLDGARRVP